MENVQRSSNADVEYENFRARRNKELKKGIIILVLGTAYLIWCRLAGFGIPCVFRLITGLECPGCGMSRAAMAISRLEFKKAYDYNRLVFTVVPILAVLIAVREYRYIKTGYSNSASKNVQTFENILLAILLICTLGFFFERNQEAFKDLFGKLGR